MTDMVARKRSPGADSRAPQISAEPAATYVCECGKRWNFSKKDVGAKGSRTFQCVCGRKIVLERGVAYSTTT